MENFLSFTSISKMSDLVFRTNKETLEFINENRNLSRDKLLEKTKAFFGSIKTERKNTLYLKFQDYLKTHKIIQQNIKRKIMKDLGGHGKHFGNPPDSFIPKSLTMYKFVQENENGSFSCETCDCSEMSSNELHKHINLYHCAEKRDAFSKECFLKMSKHPDFKLWQQETANVPLVTFASIEEKDIHDEELLESKSKKKVLKMSENSMEQNGNEDTQKETFQDNVLLDPTFWKLRELFIQFKMTVQRRKLS